ncbi:MAG: glycosyltransferase, partial [Cyanobacteria bacterium P01_A01_bin.17]
MTLSSSTNVQIESEHLQIGFVPFITSNSYQTQLAEQLTQLGVRVCALDGGDYFLPWAAWRMRLKVVHIHWLDTFYWGKNTFRSYLKLSLFIAGLILLKLTEVKIVWTVHNLKRHECLNPRLERICTAAVAKISHRLIVHCDIAKTKIAESFPFISSEKVVVIPHGSYIGQYDNKIEQKEARKVLDISESSFVFLFLGQVRAYKGIIDLIEAFKQLDEAENTTLLIAGKVVKDSVGKDIQAHVGDSSKICLNLASIKDEEIQLYMNCADIVVFPYKNVLTSGAVILAMSFAKPCIASKVGCIENTLDSDGAYLYESDDPSGLLAALQAALQERTRMSEMGQH